MGHRSEKTAAGEGLINLVGSQELEEKMPKWPGQSPFAAVQHAAA